jgi:hypothetical protein
MRMKNPDSISCSQGLNRTPKGDDWVARTEKTMILSLLPEGKRSRRRRQEEQER